MVAGTLGRQSHCIPNKKAEIQLPTFRVGSPNYSYLATFSQACPEIFPLDYFRSYEIDNQYQPL